MKVLGVQNAGRELGDVAGFETTFTINRMDYGVGPDWNILSNDVSIHLLIGASSFIETTGR